MGTNEGLLVSAKEFLGIKTCPVCKGKGWIAGHNSSSQAHDGEGKCLGYCPIQIECEVCDGIGFEL